MTDGSGAYSVDKPTANMPTGRYEVSITPPMEVEDRSEKPPRMRLDGTKDRKPAAAAREHPNEVSQRP